MGNVTGNRLHSEIGETLEIFQKLARMGLTMSRNRLHQKPDLMDFISSSHHIKKIAWSSCQLNLAELRNIWFSVLFISENIPTR